MNENIRLLLDNLRRRFQTVNPFILAELLGINIIYVPFLKNPLGQYIRLLNEPTILLSKSVENTNERFFVLAHELHHALAHEEISSYYTLNGRSQATMEQEADKFATLLCFELFMEEYERLPDSAQELRYNYGVPLEYGEYIKE